MAFPAKASYEFKKQLINCKRRALQTKDLYEAASGTRGRVKFNTNSVERFPWLIAGDKGVYCIYCKLFLNSSETPKNAGEFTVKPYKSFSKAALMEQHGKKNYHSIAQSKAIAFRSVCNGEQPSIAQQITGNTTDFVVRQRRLVAVSKTLLSLVKQSQPLRGHKNEKESNEPIYIEKDGHIIAKGDVNRGNFLHSLAMRRDAGDEDIDAVLNDKARYISPAIQNELLSLMANQVTSQIVCQVSQTYFTLIADETTDVSTTEQLCVAVRYLNKETVNIEERFMTFVEVSSITGEEIARNIKESLAKVNLDMELCRGQAYDGASNMSGSKKGAAALIRAQYPLAVYQHCQSHCLNLVLMKMATSIPEISHVWDVQGRLVTFFSSSPKRTGHLEEMIESSDMGSVSKTRLKSLCKTRWTERYDALRTTVALMPVIIQTLDHIAISGNKNDAGPARTMRSAIQNFPFIVALCITNQIIDLTCDLCTRLQGRSLDVATANSAIEAVKTRLRELRESCDHFHGMWYRGAKELSRLAGAEESKPRTGSAMSHRSNHQTGSTEEYYRAVVSVPMLDMMIQEMDERFKNPHTVLFVIPTCVVSGRWRYRTGEETWASETKEALQMYKDDFPSWPCIDTELAAWSHLWHDKECKGEAITDSALKSYKVAIAVGLPNIAKALELVCCLPITSNEAERSFSVLKLIKSERRSTMTTERLNSLTTLSIHRDVDVDLTATVMSFLGQRPTLK